MQQDEERVRDLNEQCRKAWYGGDYAKGRELAQESLQLAKSIGFESGAEVAENNLAIILTITGHYTQACDIFFKLLRSAESREDKDRQSSMHNSLGNVFWRQKMLQDAMHHYGESMRLNREMEDTKGMADNANNMGIVNFELREWDKALLHFQQALEIRRLLLTKAKKAGEDTRFLRQDVADCILNVATCAKYENRHTQALQDYEVALSIYSELNARHSMADCYSNLGVLYTMMERYEEAEQTLQKALDMSYELEVPESIRDTLGAFFDLYERKGDYAKALHYYKAHIKKRDELVNEANTKNTAQMKAQYEDEKRDAELHQLRLMAETQTQLTQQEKLASLGRLAAGIAHEMQNPLNFVLNFSDTSKELIDEILNTTDDAERQQLLQMLKQNLARINEQGKRADGIVRSMLHHSRASSGHREPTDLNRICTETYSLAYSTIQRSHPAFECVLDKQLQSDLPMANVVTQDLARVMLNIISNALEALLEKSNKQEKAGFMPAIQLRTKVSEEMVHLIVRDNGPGISEEVRQKMFEPLFTTKPTGQGTGLGLSISHDIIMTHGGSISVRSEPGSFTEMTVKLPL